MIYNNKLVWITGASSGIGEALAYEFSKMGAEIIISARRLEELERVRNKCQFPNKVHVRKLDLSLHNEIDQIASEVIESFGKIDILINNGGVSQRSLVKDTPFELDKRIMDINYFGTIKLTKAILPTMLKFKKGHIVTITSLTGKFGAPLRSAYAASKHALHGFFDTLRSEIWRDGVYITLVCPGYISTNVSVNALTANGQPQNKMDEELANGMKPEKLAKYIIKAIEQKKEELLIGGKETLGVYIKRFFPKRFSKIIRN